MSWSGTVTCRWCYKQGHNKRSCPEYTEHLKRLALKEIDNGEGYNGYWGKQYNKRVRATGLYADGTKMSAEAMATTKQKRVCKYCGKRGHNRRTCPQLKADKAATVASTAELRARVVEGLKQAGLGIGAIITREEYGTETGHMVIGFQLHELTSESVGHNPRFLQTRTIKTEGVSHWNRENVTALPVLPGVPELENSWYGNTVKVAAPVSAAQVAAGIPEDWVEDDSFVNDLYAERQHPDYHENSWNS